MKHWSHDDLTASFHDQKLLNPGRNLNKGTLAMDSNSGDITDRRFRLQEGLPNLRARQVIGKYRIERKIGEGGFAAVYAASDLIEGIRVAIKIPHAQFACPETLEQFRQEIRLVARLDHPNLVAIKDASVIDGRLIVVTKLGEQNLEQRLQRRLGIQRAVEYSLQMLSAVSYAHSLGIIHCDLKPENFVIYPGNQIRLTDFGIAKVARKTISGSGTGTVGHMSPEQAMGKPSARSDVFSLGLILFRMFSGHWPEYPFNWPPPGTINLRRRKVPPAAIKVIRKSIEVLPRNRFADATRFENAFHEAIEGSPLASSLESSY